MDLGEDTSPKAHANIAVKSMPDCAGASVLSSEELNTDVCKIKPRDAGASHAFSKGDICPPWAQGQGLSPGVGGVTRRERHKVSAAWGGG